MVTATTRVSDLEQLPAHKSKTVFCVCVCVVSARAYVCVFGLFFFFRRPTHYSCAWREIDLCQHTVAIMWNIMRQDRIATPADLDGPVLSIISTTLRLYLRGIIWNFDWRGIANAELSTGYMAIMYRAPHPRPTAANFGELVNPQTLTTNKPTKTIITRKFYPPLAPEKTSSAVVIRKVLNTVRRILGNVFKQQSCRAS